MPLLRVQRYKAAGGGFVTYFVTAPSYDALNQDVVAEVDPALATQRGTYALLRTTGTISNTKTPVGPTATWIGGSHPSGYALSAPFIGVQVINGTSYNCIFITVS